MNISLSTETKACPLAEIIQLALRTGRVNSLGLAAIVFCRGCAGSIRGDSLVLEEDGAVVKDWPANCEDFVTEVSS